MEGGPRRLPFIGDYVDSEVPRHVLDFRRSREGFEHRASKAGFDEKEAWRGVLKELYSRGVGDCRQMVDGAVEILV